MPDDTPDVYADGFQVVTNAYGATFMFSKREAVIPPPGQSQAILPQAVVRVSLQQAKVIAMVMRRHLKQWERDNNVEIAIPPKLFAELGLSVEDWKDLT